MKKNKNILEKLQKAGVKDIEEITVEIPAGTPLKEGETRTYIHVQADYMLPTGGELNGTPGMKFEIIREDIGLVMEVIITDSKVLASLREVLTHILDEQINETGIYR